MEWIQKLNDAMEYIENHICDKTDYEKIAQIAACSQIKFQRLFAFALDMTVTEYIRSRRMTKAANDLIHSDIKIIDLANKYGYESSESFTRAFSAFHGMSPSAVRKLGIFKTFEQISFQFQINGGSIIMGSKIVVRIEEFSNVKAATFYSDGEKPEEDAFFQMRKWAKKNLPDYVARRCIGYAPIGHHPNGEDSEEHPYIAQMLIYENEVDEITNLGAEVRDSPHGLFIVGNVVLNEFGVEGTVDIGLSMKKSSQEIFACLNEMRDYELDMSKRRFIEEQVFEKEWFDLEDNDPREGMSEFKLWLPIRKKEQNQK